MKRVILALLVLLFLLPGLALAGAPNSADGDSDGSGLDSQVGPVASGQTDDSAGPAGPAPNSGDGVNDGSGMD